MTVVDASAMVDFLIDDPPAPGLVPAIADADLHAPALLDFEVVAAMRGNVLGAKISAGRAEQALVDFAALSIVRHHMTFHLPQILALRDNFAAYDAAYVVLAQGLQAPLVTTDAKLREALRLGVDVHHFRGATA